jgi:hypothetical protein
MFFAESAPSERTTTASSDAPWSVANRSPARARRVTSLAIEDIDEDEAA